MLIADRWLGRLITPRELSKAIVHRQESCKLRRAVCTPSLPYYSIPEILKAECELGQVNTDTAPGLKHKLSPPAY